MTTPEKPTKPDLTCKFGHTFALRPARGHDEWYCVACYFIPTTRSLLAAYVEKHGGRITP